MPLTPDDQVKYKALYLQTAKPYVKDIVDSLTSFQHGGVDPQKLEVAHRAAHSMGSQSAMMGYMQVSEFSRAFESIFKAKTDNQIAFTPELLEKATSSATVLASAIEAIETTNAEPNLASEREALLAAAQLPA